MLNIVFPSLAVITVPKMPIITPKGDEIIMRKKYNNNMTLLNEAFEQKKELINLENTQNLAMNNYAHMQQRQLMQDDTPSASLSTSPNNIRKSSYSDASPIANSSAHHSRGQNGSLRPRNQSGESELVNKKPLIGLHRVAIADHDGNQSQSSKKRL